MDFPHRSEGLRVDMDHAEGLGRPGEVGPDDIAISGELIELVHIERMDDDSFWARIDLKDGRALVLNLWARPKRKLHACVDWD